MLRFSSKFGVLWPAIVVALSALPAQEAEAASPTPSAELVEQGLALRRARDDRAALEVFRRAYRAEPSPMILAQLALAEQAMGEFVVAEQHLTESLGSSDPWITSHRSALETALSVIQSRLGWLEVRTSASAVDLVVDGTVLPVEASPFRLNAGKHALLLRERGGKEVTHTFDLEPQSRYVYQLELTNAQPPPPQVPTPRPRPATSSLPPARVALPPRRGSSTWAYVTATLAGVALIDAIGASLLRQSYVTAYNEPSCAPDRSQRCAGYRSSANTLGTIALVGYAVAGAAGVTSIALLTEPWWHGGRSAGPTSALLGVSGAF